VIDEEQLDEALAEGRETGERLGEVVVRRGWATEDAVAKVLAEQWSLNYVDRASIWFDADALARLSREHAQRLEALPTRVEDGRVVVAVAEPTEQRLAALRSVIGEDTVVVVVPKTALQAGLQSELLSSDRQPGSATEPGPEPDPGPAPEPRPRPVTVTRPSKPAAPSAPAPELYDDVAALAAQARAMAESIEAQAAAMRRGGAEEVDALERRVEELEAELATRRSETAELRKQLKAMLHLISDN
jgi:type IV pilus assembly protein PilB